MKRKSTLGIGSISEGTMRECDLIPSFLWAADDLSLSRQERQSVNRIRKASNVDEEADYWAGENASWDLETLFDILGNHTPDYCYFGSHPGDGSDYGVWISQESIDEAVYCKDVLPVSDLSEVPAGFSGTVYHVNDHGNASLYAYARGKSRELWAVV